MNTRISRTMHEQICDKMREEIISCRIEPGSKITIQGIADKYSVSPIPVREVFKTLEADRLIENIPYKGTTVLKFDKLFIKNIYEVRTAMEALISRNSSSKLTEKDISELKEIQKNISAITQNNIHDNFLDLNKNFHDLINSKNENTEAVGIYNRYTSLINITRKIYGYSIVRHKEVIKQHDKIIAAIEKKDSDLVFRLVLEHGIGAERDILKIFESKL